MVKSIENKQMKVTLEDLIQAIYPLPQEVLEDVLGYFQYLEYPKNFGSIMISSC